MFEMLHFDALVTGMNRKLCRIVKQHCNPAGGRINDASFAVRHRRAQRLIRQLRTGSGYEVQANRRVVLGHCDRFGAVVGVGLEKKVLRLDLCGASANNHRVGVITILRADDREVACGSQDRNRIWRRR
jgi:hypothetical protein